MNLKDRFSQFPDDFLQFEKVDNPRSRRSDLHAFLLLDELQSRPRPLVWASKRDEIYLDIDLAELNAVVTDAQILELVRCGVRCDSEGLCLFT